MSLFLTRCMLIGTVFTAIVGGLIALALGRDLRTEAPEFSWLFTPLLVSAWIYCLALASGACLTWVLLTRTRQGRIFHASSHPWVRALIATCWVAAASGLPFIWATGCVTHGPPIIALGSVAFTALPVTVGLLLHVLYGILRDATALETDMAGVV